MSSAAEQKTLVVPWPHHLMHGKEVTQVAGSASSNWALSPDICKEARMLQQAQSQFTAMACLALREVAGMVRVGGINFVSV